MLDSTLFQKLSEIGAQVRGMARAFGGLQLVACGDFYQLPPVGLGNYGASFAFSSSAWKGMGMRTCALCNIVRQSGDKSLVAVLNEIRLGDVHMYG